MLGDRRLVITQYLFDHPLLHACDFLDPVVALVRESHKNSDVFCGNDRSSFDLTVDVCELLCDEAKLIRQKRMLLCHEVNFVCHEENFVCHEVSFFCHEVMSLRDAKTCLRRKPNLE